MLKARGTGKNSETGLCKRLAERCLGETATSKSYKGHDVVKNHDRPCPERTQHKEEEGLQL